MWNELDFFHVKLWSSGAESQLGTLNKFLIILKTWLKYTNNDDLGQSALEEQTIPTYLVKQLWFQSLDQAQINRHFWL